MRKPVRLTSIDAELEPLIAALLLRSTVADRKALFEPLGSSDLNLKQWLKRTSSLLTAGKHLIVFSICES
jgi:hypothetical protein